MPNPTQNDTDYSVRLPRSPIHRATNTPGPQEALVPSRNSFWAPSVHSQALGCDLRLQRGGTTVPSGREKGEQIVFWSAWEGPYQNLGKGWLHRLGCMAEWSEAGERREGQSRTETQRGDPARRVLQTTEVRSGGCSVAFKSL